MQKCGIISRRRYTFRPQEIVGSACVQRNLAEAALIDEKNMH
jgi:hypothetical protein